MSNKEFLFFYAAALFLMFVAVSLAIRNTLWSCSTLFFYFSVMLTVILTQEIREKK